MYLGSFEVAKWTGCSPIYCGRHWSEMGFCIGLTARSTSTTVHSADNRGRPLSERCFLLMAFDKLKNDMDLPEQHEEKEMSPEGLDLLL